MLMGMKEILLIEDTESDVRLLQRTLQALGIQNSIRHYARGSEALKYLAELRAAGRVLPAIVVIDLKLPDISGFEILAELNRSEFKSVLRIVVSQVEDLASIKTAYSLGAHTFITKPATREEFEELMKAYPEPWSRKAVRVPMGGPRSHRSRGGVGSPN
jgi:CheY-like chemotaxis protein